MKYSRARIILSSSMILSSISSASIFDSLKDAIPPIPSWLSSKKEIRTVHKKYSLSPQANLILKNMHGTIEIKTQWDQDHVLLKAEITAPKKEYLDQVQIVDNGAHSGDLVIRTRCLEEKSKAQVHYCLTIPADIGVWISNDQGPISIQGVRGKTYATTLTKGDIHINESSNTVVAHAQQQGNIDIDAVDGNVKATTKKGKITISGSKKSIVASAQSGSMMIHPAEIPPQSKIKLSSKSGVITVCLPHGVNADVQASTERGVVLCQHEITLKPCITTLDSHAWRQFKRSVNGTLGSGVSQIHVHSSRSNIHITKETTIT
jgi:hypothetical protein